MSFESSIKAFSEKTQARVQKVISKSANEFANRVIERTPVDTGRAKSGWELSLTEAEATLRNQVAYIRALEYGHSQQAPQGMVRVTIAEWPQIVKAALL